MNTLYESILKSTSSGKIKVLKDLLLKEPNLKDLYEIKKLWKEFGLNLPYCNWTIYEGKSYAYKSDTRNLIIFNYSGVFVGNNVNVISTVLYFDSSIGTKKKYNEWMDKIEKELHVKISEVKNSTIWKKIEF